MTSGRARPSIAFFIPGIFLGGAERHMVLLREQLEARGFASSLVVYADEAAPEIMARPGAHDPIFLGRGSLSSPLGWVAVWQALRRLRPDVVLCVNQAGFVVVRIVAFGLWRRPKICCLFHTTVLQPYEKKTERPFRWLARVSDAIFFVGRRQMEHWQRLGLSCRRMVTIFNGLDLDRFSRPDPQARRRLRDELAIAPEATVLMVVAALRDEKNHLELVDAVAKVRERGFDPRVILVGEGPCRAAIEARIAEKGLGEVFRLVGARSDVPAWIAAADVGVLTSLSESLPLSAIEFLAGGRPMIASDVGGIRDVVTPGLNGLVYPSGDPASLADRIVAMLDPAVRGPLAAAAAESVAGFRLDAMVDAYEHEILALAAPATRPAT